MVHGRDHVKMQDDIVIPVCFAVNLQCAANHMSAIMTRGRDSRQAKNTCLLKLDKLGLDTSPSAQGVVARDKVPSKCLQE